MRKPDLKPKTHSLPWLHRCRKDSLPFETYMRMFTEYESKACDRMTVAEICGEAGIDKAVFYRHYKKFCYWRAYGEPAPKWVNESSVISSKPGAIAVRELVRSLIQESKS